MKFEADNMLHPFVGEEFHPSVAANNNAAPTGRVLGNTELGKLNRLAEQLEQITSEPEFDQYAQKLAIAFSDLLQDKKSLAHKTFQSVRKFWDKLPQACQWAMLKGEAINPIALPFVNTLLEMGLISYKGHGSPVERDEALKQQAAWDHKKTEWGLRIAEVFDPEVAAMKPFLEPIMKLQNSKAKVMEIFRREMDELQIELETAGREKNVMQKKHRPQHLEVVNIPAGTPSNQNEAAAA